MRCVVASIAAACTQVCLSPALNGSSEIQRFEHSDVIEIRDGIIFDFYMYTGLPHLFSHLTKPQRLFTAQY